MSAREVLTTASEVSCGHKLPPAKLGLVSTAGTKLLTVSGKPVLTADGVKGKTVDQSPCATENKPDNGLVPCQTVSAVTTGGSALLTVNGDQPVLREPISGDTSGTVGGVTPQKLLTADAKQSLLTAT
jgi:hypothetical protein